MNQRNRSNSIQKTIAILLNVCLVVSAVPAAAFAGDSGQQVETAGTG